MIGMIKTQDLSPLKALNSFFNLAAYKITELNQGKIVDLLQSLNKEYFDCNNEGYEALRDGKISLDEAKAISKEVGELINAAASLKQFAENRIKKG